MVSDDRVPLLADGRPNRRRIPIPVVLSAIIIVVVVLLGALFAQFSEELSHRHSTWVHLVTDIPNEKKAGEMLERLTRQQSLAGSPGDLDLAMFVSDKFKQWGFPQVDIYPYDVLLSRPISSSVDVLAGGQSIMSLNLTEPPLTTKDQESDITGPYLAYSGSGSVAGPLIYVNYGRKQDFDHLIASGFNLKGAIGLARYGRIFRGLKAMLAETYGLSGLIIYSDPANDGYQRGTVYPDGEWRPPLSIQGGSTMFVSLFSGDPLTPGTAAIPDLDPQRRKFTADNSPVLPKIPVLAMGYSNALELLRRMDGDIAPKDWQGGLPVTYKLGPSTTFVHLSVNITREIMRIHNVVGTIPGSVEQDRRILLGNHRDSWVYGAVDPHSGTTTFMETARSLAHIYKRGWRPRRTLQLCSWDAEEFGLVGSTEFVEQFEQELQKEAVAYVNIDIAVSNLQSVFTTESCPSMGELIRRATKAVKAPRSEMSVYDEWFKANGARIDPIGSGSDYSGFLQYLGVTASDIRFQSQRGSYGVYHSTYDCLDWFERFGDPGYKSTLALSKVFSIMAVELASRDVLPLRLREYAEALSVYIDKLASEVSTVHADMPRLRSIASKFEQAAGVVDDVAASLDNLAVPSEKELAQVNDRLAFLERRFLLDRPLPDRDEMYYRHAVYAPGLYTGYGASVLPGIRYAFTTNNTSLQSEQIQILYERIQDAIGFLCLPQS